MHRDNAWLAVRLQFLWERYFSDVARHNDVGIIFGKAATTRLGSIRQRYARERSSVTIIRINGLFRDSAVPAYVIDEVIAHELIHYAHGFQSPHPQLHRHPHRGGVMKKEFIDRGLGKVLQLSKTWLKGQFPAMVRGARKAGILPSRRTSKKARRYRRSIYVFRF